MTARQFTGPGNPSPPRVLFAAVSLEKGTGGIAELSRQVFRALLDMCRKNLISLEVHVLECAGPQPGDDGLQAGDLPALHWHGGKRWKFALRLMLTRADVLLFDHVGLARLPGLMPSPVRRTYILLIHGVEIWKNNRKDYARTARNARLLIANSEYTARKVRAHSPALPEIRICLPGKDVSPRGRSAEPAPAVAIGPHAMLIAGRLSAEQRHKGHDHLLEAMPLILRMVPDAQLVIAGGGDDLGRLQARAAELNVARNVIFTGWVDEAQLSTLYSRCALFVMPSDGDGFGLVFLEAMAHRLPCAGLKSGAAAEIFEQGKSGILIDREDRHGTARQLAALLVDEAQRKRLAEAAFERYRSLFTGRDYAERLEYILLEFLSRQSRREWFYRLHRFRNT